MELSSLVQHNISPDNNSTTIVTVSSRDITRMKPCHTLATNQLTLRMVCGTEKMLNRKEDITPLKRCLVFGPPMANYQRDSEFRMVGL
ncbi:hypothetical protein TNCV_3060421 [Trichonephila clavipes]|uniref:Uncharacterized protein n=1 Tax=Trichonephila clavipes TaxID=2585209 RepID=A0A8X7BBA1_TRICX|nr:hypothetical protein TNCV_3060421 [Trichonephila clavipes]